MLNVFAEELHVQLSDGRIMTLRDIVDDYERLLAEEASKKATISKPKGDKASISKPKGDKASTKELKVGEWFSIDRDVIDKNKEEIRRKCNDAGDEGKALWKRFEQSNKIADENPDQYSRLIETYIFEHNWVYKTEQEMRDMCKDMGDGMADEVICDLELQMRICNGKPMDDLVKKADKLPRARVIRLRDGGTGYFGGAADNYDYDPPADLYRDCFRPDHKVYKSTPYVFR